MIRAILTADTGPIFFIGLTPADVFRMKEGILMQMQIPNPAQEVTLAFGESDEAIKDKLIESVPEKNIVYFEQVIRK